MSENPFTPIAPISIPYTAPASPTNDAQQASESFGPIFHRLFAIADPNLKQAAIANDNSGSMHTGLVSAIADPANEYQSLLGDLNAVDFTPEIDAAASAEKYFGTQADAIGNLQPPPDFGYADLALDPPPDASQITGFALPGATTASQPTGTNLPDSISVPCTTAQSFLSPGGVASCAGVAAAITNTIAAVSPGSIATAATIEGIASVLFPVAVAWIVFTGFFNFDFAAALAQYGNYIASWSESDPLGYAAWHLQNEITSLKQTLSVGTVPNEQRAVLEASLARYQSQLTLVNKMQYVRSTQNA